VDTLGEFAGQGNKMVADSLKSEWFQYVGSNLTTTREFCKHLTKKRYVHISEIPELLKGKIDGHQCEIYTATGLPYGMKEDTNVDNFIVHRGGWNCGHELIPASEVTVPKEIREKIKATLKPEKPIMPDKQTIEKQEKDVLNLFQNDKDIPDISDLRNDAQKYNLSDAEITSIKTYTNDYYTTINKALREQALTGEQESYNNVLNRALDKLKPYEGELYRGTNLREERMLLYKNAFENKTEHIEYGFTSSSIDKQIAEYFGLAFGKNAMIKIKSKTGRMIDDISFSKSEQEVLFKSKTKFRVIKFEETKTKGKKLYYIEMEEI
jgi:hypothetical protein